jgi:hypothetical protein
MACRRHGRMPTVPVCRHNRVGFAIRFGVTLCLCHMMLTIANNIGIGTNSVMAILLDIHIPLHGQHGHDHDTPHSASSCMHDVAMDMNQELRNLLAPRNTNINVNINPEKVDFTTKHTPHVTLYLADFMEDTDSMEELVTVLKETVPVLLVPCNMTLDQPLPYSAKSGYAMIGVELSTCLQLLSDTLVHRTHHLITQPAPIPDWVYALKEPLRSRKIHLIQQYGSPNVFSEFQPHVTVAYFEFGYDNHYDVTDTNSSSMIVEQKWQEMSEEFNSSNSTTANHHCHGISKSIALGRSSVGGSVLKGPLIEIPFTSMLKSRHTTTMISNAVQ